jgi:hypothetical protein
VLRKGSTWMLALGVLLVCSSVLGSIGFSIWYTNQQARSACQALDYIIHSDIQNKKFLNSVEYWARADRCGG